MNNQKTITLLLIFILAISAQAQNDDSDYLTFNDRNNVVHGVYLGFTAAYGELDGEDTYIGGVKIAYVANRQFEVGFVGNFLYSEQNIYSSLNNRNEDLVAGYGGLHLEPIFFSKSRVNLSFPMLIGAGGVGYVDRQIVRDGDDIDLDEDEVDAVFVFEPGMSLLFNISRYVQLEAGVKYRFSSTIELIDSPVNRLNGFSGGIGVKLGVFNMGRNRYKKKLD